MGKFLAFTLILVAQMAFANFCSPHFRAPKILVISGTDRIGSNTLKISTQVVELMKKKGHDVSLLDIDHGVVQHFDGLYLESPNVELKKNYISKINAADAVIFVFPEYNRGLPGILKMFLDYVPLPTAFGGKPIGMISDSAGVLGGLMGAQTLGSVLSPYGAEIVGKSHVMIPGVDKVIQDDKIQDAAILKRIETAYELVVQKATDKLKAQMQINEFMDLAVTAKIAINVELSSQAEVVGHVKNIERDVRGFPISMTLEGPVEITNAGKPITYQLFARQTKGLFIPIGMVKTEKKGIKSLSSVTSIDKLAELGFEMHKEVTLTYTSGIEVKGLLSNAFFNNGKLQVLTLNNATISKNGTVLKEHSTDLFDLVVGEGIVSATQFRTQ